jgi:predicted acylesterase/phospholipase RssA
MRLILSIRGGGIRGIIPCCCLMKLESQLGGVTRDHLDFCAGTSTGALLTAGIAAGIPAGDLLQFYTSRCHDIFTPTGVLATVKRGVQGFMYDPKRLYSVLHDVLGAQAAWTINDSPLRILISATAMDGHNWFFVKDNPCNACTTGSVKLIDAAVASSCAPTYFDHWRIDGIQGRTLRFFDGGVGGTANPAYQACVEAFEFDDFQPADTRLVALGTGYFPPSGDPPGSLLAAIGWTTSTLVDSGEDWVEQAVKRQWPGVMQAFNIELASDIGEDHLSGVPALLETGRQLAAQMDWEKLIGRSALKSHVGVRP